MREPEREWRIRYSVRRARRAARAAPAGSRKSVPICAVSITSAPQLALFHLAQQARRDGVVELPLHMLLAQPARIVAHSGSRPDLIAGIAMNALDRIEQCRRQFGIRRENGTAGRDGRQQGGRNAIHAQCCWTLGGGSDDLERRPFRGLGLEQFIDAREHRRENLRLRQVGDAEGSCDTAR